MIDRRCLWSFGCSRRNNNTHPRNATNNEVFLRATILPPSERGREKHARRKPRRVRRLLWYHPPLPEEREHENQNTRRPRFCRGRRETIDEVEQERTERTRFHAVVPFSSPARKRVPRSNRSSSCSVAQTVRRGGFDQVNDPSAGSPTETLLRLLLPLDGRVQ